MVKLGIIGGSGLDNPDILKNFSQIEVQTPYGSPSSVLTCGKFNDVDVVILARHGKGHTIYPTAVNYRANIYALYEQKCTHILATTAVGSLRQEIKPGDIVFADQFIDFTKHRICTFFDKEVKHTPMAEPFDAKLRGLLSECAQSLNLRYHSKATVVTIEGPRFSTKAESHMFRVLGADIINMSTVPEVVLANELGIKYQTIAMSTDYDCWKDDEEPVSWEMIVKRMKENTQKVIKLITTSIALMAKRQDP